MGGTGRALCFGALCLAAVIRDEAPEFMRLSAAPVSASSHPPLPTPKPFAAALASVLRKAKDLGKAQQGLAEAIQPRFRPHASHGGKWTPHIYRHHPNVAVPDSRWDDRFGYDGKIPHFIWQTYSTRDITNERLKASFDSWSAMNPKWHHELLVDKDVAAFFEQHYDAQTNAVYHALPLGAMKADMFRYAVMYTYGGVYADVDVEALQPIAAWLGDASRSCKVIVGIENDVHFCQWAFAALPKQPVFKRAVELVVERVVKGGGLGPQGLNVADASFVHYYTGPGLFTTAVMDTLGKLGQETCKGVRNATTGEHSWAGCVHSSEALRPALATEGICVEDDAFFHGRNVQHYYHSTIAETKDGDSWQDAALMLHDEQKIMNSSDWQAYEVRRNQTGADTTEVLPQNATGLGGNASAGGVPSDPLGAPANASAANSTAPDLGDSLAQWRRPAAPVVEGRNKAEDAWNKAAAHLREEQRHLGHRGHPQGHRGL